MIEFMVVAAPRSGTGWAANWLTTESSLCMHGLNARMHYSQWDSISSRKLLGVSDPSISRFPVWLNAHQARKVILHRDGAQIAASFGMENLADTDWGLDRIDGMHVDWNDLFDHPKAIYEFLLQRPFDAERHAELVRLQVTCMPKRVTFDKGVYLRLMEEMRCN